MLEVRNIAEASAGMRAFFTSPQQRQNPLYNTFQFQNVPCPGQRYAGVTEDFRQRIQGWRDGGACYTASPGSDMLSSVFSILRLHLECTAECPMLRLILVFVLRVY